MTLRFVTRVAAAAALTAVFAVPASAQTYPNKPIKMIVSIAAGSLTDVIMRAAANELSPRLGQPVVIENRGGAAGIPAAQACANSPGDGYTLCNVFHNQLSFNPVMFNKLPYDADKDLVPIARLYFLIESIAVHPSLGVESVAQLKTLAQSKKGGLNWGTLGAGSAPELFLKWINKEWGTEIVGIPYRGGGPMAQAVAANEVQVAGVGLGNFLGLHQGGKVKVIAVSAPKRSALVPNVMTFQEAGLGGYPQRGWWGLSAPKGTSKEIVAKLNAEFVRLFSDPKFTAFLDKQAVVPAPTTPEAFAAFVKQDRVHAANLLKLANVPAKDYTPPPPPKPQ
ncbi:MAG: tripartite tricarboxylate transporter substrate binding protein [Alphaproteobacteria bacterium]|nr:tripartite tricarboxylate transporter substrate binding protein [Alphaproteobacteria bacterium]